MRDSLKRQRISTPLAVLFYMLLCMGLIAVIYPFFTMIISSLKETREIFRQPFALPVPPKWGNYVMAWGRANFSIYLCNSLIVAVCSIGMLLVVSLLAAYPISRYHLSACRVLNLFFLVGLMLPIRLGVVRLYLLMRDLGLLDTLWSLIFTYTAMRIPFSIFILTGFMQTVPESYEDAARIDGCNELQVLYWVIMPLVRPALGIITIFSAIAIWNDFFFPFLFIYTDAVKTLSAGIGTFFGQFLINWGLLYAGLNIASIPLVILYLLMSRQFIKGLAIGGLK